LGLDDLSLFSGIVNFKVKLFKIFGAFLDHEDDHYRHHHPHHRPAVHNYAATADDHHATVEAHAKQSSYQGGMWG